MLRRGLILVLLLAGSLALAQTTTKRLILKDGSYQSVTKYEIKGDRVRYLSAERYEWEDMPTDLVDWPATKKYEEDLTKPVSHSAEEIDKEVADEKAMEDAKTPLVAPNLRLPMTGGVFVLDYYRDTPQLIELGQNNSQIGDKDMKGNLIRQVYPLASSKQKIILDGIHAKTQVHVARPALFFNVEDQPVPTDDKQPTAGNKEEDAALIPPKPVERYRFVRVAPGKNERVVGSLKVTFTGKVSQQQTFIPTKGELLGGGWVKVVPEQDLAPGEYAVAEMLGEKEMNLYVWDFGVNPAAPENATAWKPEENAKPEAPKGPPVLEKRPKN